jgi:Raf kinase inhibitor-like YbhB/YbcL family protein
VRATAAAVLVAVTACGTSGPPRRIDAPATIAVTSTAYADGGQIPAAYTCRGTRTPIPLRLANVPPATRELALTMVDPDAPRGPFTHWVVYGIPPGTTSLDTGVAPSGAAEGRPYQPPCPPGSSSHHYVVTVYALDVPSGLPAGRSVDDLVGAVRAHVLAQGTLTGLFP